MLLFNRQHHLVRRIQIVRPRHVIRQVNHVIVLQVIYVVVIVVVVNVKIMLVADQLIQPIRVENVLEVPVKSVVKNTKVVIVMGNAAKEIVIQGELADLILRLWL